MLGEVGRLRKVVTVMMVAVIVAVVIVDIFLTRQSLGGRPMIKDIPSLTIFTFVQREQCGPISKCIPLLQDKW